MLRSSGADADAFYRAMGFEDTLTRHLAIPLTGSRELVPEDPIDVDADDAAAADSDADADAADADAAVDEAAPVPVDDGAAVADPADQEDPADVTNIEDVEEIAEAAAASVRETSPGDLTGQLGELDLLFRDGDLSQAELDLAAAKVAAAFPGSPK